MTTTTWGLWLPNCDLFDCEYLKLLQVYEGTGFGHVMSKACNYATNGDKVFMGLILVNVKTIQNSLYETITWIEKSRKGK
jgi:hypothetical protein